MALDLPFFGRRERRRGINRTHSRTLALLVPWLSVAAGSLAPMLPVIALMPILPPFGFLMLLGWRLVRPGLLPIWAGLPLGAFDDLYSGQPFGCAVLLWSLTMLALDQIEQRFPWRGLVYDWLTAATFCMVYLVLSALLSGGFVGFARLSVLGPQILLSVLSLPILFRMVAVLDRIRLLRVRTAR